MVDPNALTGDTDRCVRFANRSSERYDVIVVGARCAGSPTAMLLARAGLRILVIDRAPFPSDTISGHALKPPAVAHLQRWGLLGNVLATNCPPIRARHVQFGQRVLDLPTQPPHALPLLAPRRFVLDALLLRAARAAGAEVWERASLLDIIWQDGRVAGAHISDRDGHLPGPATGTRRTVAPSGMPDPLRLTHLNLARASILALLAQGLSGRGIVCAEPLSWSQLGPRTVRGAQPY